MEQGEVPTNADDPVGRLSSHRDGLAADLEGASQHLLGRAEVLLIEADRLTREPVGGSPVTVHQQPLNAPPKDAQILGNLVKRRMLRQLGHRRRRRIELELPLPHDPHRNPSRSETLRAGPLTRRRCAPNRRQGGVVSVSVLGSRPPGVGAMAKWSRSWSPTPLASCGKGQGARWCTGVIRRTNAMTSNQPASDPPAMRYAVSSSGS